MNQEERRRFLIEELLRERPSCRRQEIPADTDRQKVLLRSLMNVRHPGAISQRFLEVQDAYLQGELAAKKITRLSELSPLQNGIYLWRGEHYYAGLWGHRQCSQFRHDRLLPALP